MPFTTENASEMQARRKTRKGMPKYEPKPDEKLDEVRDIIGNSIYWLGREKPKNDDEVALRIKEFFDRVQESGEFPSVEKLALCMGVTRQTLNDWEHGSMGNVRANYIRMAKEVLAAIDAELAQKRKIDSVTAIFRSKNYYGMRDVQEVEVNRVDPLGDNVDKKKIAAKYAGALPMID